MSVRQGFVLGFALWASAASAITLPSGFVSQRVVGGFDKPTAVAVLPNGDLLVTEKVGLLWLVQNGVKQATPLLDLRAEVNKEADRGLLDVTLHPDFVHNGYLYLLYVYDDVPGLPHRANDEAVWQRLVRYTLRGDVVDASSRKILFGTAASDSPAECFSSHAIGTARFAPDGSLFVSVGDGAHWDFADGGQDVTANDPTCKAVFGAIQDVGSFRAQTLNSLAGKILRLDPETGLGLPSNPFFDGDPGSFRSKVWARGFKNPFRFSLAPAASGPGTLFIGDVGTDVYEEIDRSTGGENFGWPCFEGPNPQPQYQTDPNTQAKCAQLPASQVVPPMYASAHNHQNRATGGVLYYTGTRLPAAYRGAVFVADYAQSFIDVLHLTAAGDQVASVEHFATAADNPVDLVQDPRTGDLLYVTIVTGEVRRLTYTLVNQPPEVHVSATPPGGPAPLTVQLSSNGTVDPEGDALTFDWDFGDGSPHSTAANPTHVYGTTGTFVAKLTVADGHGNVASASTPVQTSNSPPTVTITNPLDGTHFEPNQQFSFHAAANDPNGDALAWKWEVRIVHLAHEHFDYFDSTQADPPPFTAVDHSPGERYSYLVHVTVTDPGGLSATDEVRLLPPGLTNAAPTAAFSATPSSGQAPLTVTFDAGESSDPDGDYLTYDWDFGDGTTGSGVQATHTFDTAGTRTVTLKLTDTFGATASVQHTVTATAPLVAEWMLDEGSGSVAGDASGHGLHGAVRGGTWTSGQQGGALLLNGIADQVAIGDSALLRITGEMTVAGWVRITDPTRLSYMRILSKKPAFDAPEGYALSYNPGRHLLEFLGSGADGAAAKNVVLDGNWHHLAATVSGTSARLYVDGVDKTTDATVSALAGGTTPLYLGREAGGGNFLQGGLDDVRLYSRALSAADISGLVGASTPNHPPVAKNQSLATAQDTAITFTLSGSDADADPLTFAVSSAPLHGTLSGTAPTLTYQPAAGFTGSDAVGFTVSDGRGGSGSGTIALTVNAPAPPPATGPSVRFALDEGSGAKATDEVGGLSCALSGQTWVAGRIGGAVAFDGVRGHGECSVPPALAGGSALTMSAWVQVADPALSRYMRIFSSKTTWDAATGFSLTYNPVRQLVQVHTGGSDYGEAARVALGTGWHHLAAVVDGTTVKIYVDGVDKTTDGVVSPLRDGSTPLRLGADGAGNQLKGGLDDVRVYPRVLTPAEVGQLAGGGS